MWVVYSLIGILAIAVQTVSAQEVRRDTLHISVYFTPGFSSVTSESELCKLDSLADRLQSLRAAADGRISGILIKGWASPEGEDLLNERLSMNRARKVVRYLADRAALPDTLLAAEGGGVDWRHLAEEASACPELPDKEEVLRILENTPVREVRDGRVVDGRKRRLRMLQGGIPYKYLYKGAFPALRRADIRAVVSGGSQLPPPPLPLNIPLKHIPTMRDTLPMFLRIRAGLRQRSMLLLWYRFRQEICRKGILCQCPNPVLPNPNP